MLSIRFCRVLAALVFTLLGAVHSMAASPQQGRSVVYVARLGGMIDLGLSPYVERVLKEARRERAALVVLDIDTFGGRLDAAVAIRDALIASEQRSVALVRTRAISAGALIGLATTELAMGSSATIGAATPVQLQPGGPSVTADEKTISYVRKEFAATAERRGKSRQIAEAMVDPSVHIPGVVEKGKLLTLTTSEALEHEVADFRAESVRQVLDHYALQSAEVREFGISWAEKVVRFVTNPALASILMTIGLLGVLVELRTPGFGVPGAIGLLCLGLFFWGHWIARLAGLEELALIVVGALLLAAELLVIPGFGVAGVLGIAALALGLGLSLVGAGVTGEGILGAISQVLISFMVAGVGLLLLLRYLPRLPFGRGVILTSSLPSETVAPPERHVARLGQRGISVSPLRPAGIAEFGAERVDVVSEGVFVDVGERIEVVHQDGNRVVVRRVTAPSAS